jgi:hypothetical protein
LPDIEVAFVPVHVDASHFYVITWSSHVDVVSKEHDLLAAGDTTRQHFGWRLLNGDFLVIAIDGLLFVDGEGPIRLAGSTVPKSDIVDTVDVEGSFQESALHALVYYLFELREDLTADGHNSLDSIAERVLRMSFPRWT